MVIRILSSQIPAFWEVIKFAVVSVNEVDKENWGVYLNNLLHSLLNDKSQCFVRFNDERKLLALLITELSISKITNEKSLLLQVLYSWKRTEDKEWVEEFTFIKEFASHEECKHISFESRNPRVWQLGEALGFKENLRRFDLTLGGV